MVGAAVGGCLMWQLGRFDPEGIRRFLDTAPAVSPEMIADAEARLRVGPVGALFAGAFSGMPYKVLAATAPSAGVNPVEFLILGAPARLSRFMAVTLFAAALNRILARWLGQKLREATLAAVWAGFYAAFWLLMPT